MTVRLWSRAALVAAALAPSLAAAQSALPPPARNQAPPSPPLAPPLPPPAATTPRGLPPSARGGAAPVPAGELAETPFPGLADVLQRARQHAPALSGARGQVQVARAGYAGARFGPLGNPYTEIFADRALVSGRSPSIMATVWLPVEIWGQRSRRVAEVDARVAWSGDVLRSAQLLATADAALAYGTALVESERARLFESILATARDEAALYRARVDAGDATEQDSTLAALEVARTSVQLAETRADVQRSLTELARLTGVDLYAPPTDASLRPPLPDNEAGDPDALAARSPHVRSLQREADYHLRLRDRIASEAKMPTSLMLNGARGEFGEARIGLGLALTIPVFRYNQAERAQAEADQQRALAQASTQQASIRSVLAGIRRERRQLAVAIQEVITSLEPAGQAAVDAAQAMLKQGKGEMLRVLTARRDLAQLRTRRLDLVQREWALYSQMLALVGSESSP